MGQIMPQVFKRHQKIPVSRVSAWKKIPTISCVLIFVVVGTLFGAERQAVTADKTAVKYPDNQIVVTYFHTDYRCATCMKLETYSQEAVEKNFSKELQVEAVIFRTLNVDKPENKHYIKEYNLYTKSLVVIHTRGGKVIRWKNLPDIWKHVRDRSRFEAYVRNEILAFMKDL